MAPQASSAMAMPSAWQPEPFPASLRLVPTDPATTEQGEGRLRPLEQGEGRLRPLEQGEGRLRPLEVAECTMCGVTRPLGLLVPDGSEACVDVRWYCKDVRSCTERWTTALPQQPAGLPQETEPATPLRPPPAVRRNLRPGKFAAGQFAAGQ